MAHKQENVSPYGNMIRSNQATQSYGGMQQPNAQINPEMHKKHMMDMCTKYHLYFVQIQTIDGQTIEGIIDEYDNDGVTLIIPYGDMDDDYRVNGYGYGHGFGPGFEHGFGHGFGHGFPGRFRRFRRFRFPFFNIHGFGFPFFY